MPDWAAEIRRRLAAARLDPAREAEIVEELSQHLDDRRNELQAGGVAPAEAARRALEELKNGDRLERYMAGLGQARRAAPEPPPADARPWQSMAFDVRQSVRALCAAPVYSLVALAVLTLGIGATTAIVSVVDAVIVRPLPFPQHGRLVAMGEYNFKAADTGSANLVAPQNFLDWRDQQDVFTGLAAVGYASISLMPEEGQEPEILRAQAVTADFFPVLGTAPLVGQPFTIENERDGNALVAVISYGLWQRRFGGAADVVGRSLRGQRAQFRVAAVMPPTFTYPVGAVQPTDVWIPIVFRPEDRIRANDFAYRLQVIGRLRPGVSIDAAQTRMDAITAGLAAQTPRWFEDRTAKVEHLDSYLTRGVRQWMCLLMAAVGLVLAIACVNLSNLTLARASSRAKEFAVRFALGASRWQVARPLLIESVLLSLAGAAAGVVLAWGGVEILRSAIPADIPRVADIAVNWRVLAAAMALGVVTGPVFCAVPMLHFSRGSNSAGLANRSNTAGAGYRRFRGALVVAEVALAAVLLIGSGLFMASFQRVSSIDLGLDPHQLLTVRVRPLVSAGNWEQAQRNNRGLLRNLLEQVRAIPGVETASMVGSGVPLRGDLRTVDLAIPGRELPQDEALDFNEVSPDYFRTLRVPLRKGRFFTDADRQGSQPVVIINEAAASKYFPGQDPIGKSIRFDGMRTIAGVVGNIRHDGPESDWRGQGFIPLDQSQSVGATLALRLSRDPQAVLPFIKTAIWSHFPATPLPDIQTLEQYLHALTAQRRFNMLLLGLFGASGIAIALVGIYGVMAYDTTQRVREIGIRMSLGALPAGILRLVLGRASMYLAAGLAIGLAAAWGLSGLVKAFLFQVQPHDLRVFMGVGALLGITGLAAAFAPARRAARVDPLVSLRLE